MADENVDLWAIDEVHFQQHGSRCQMWVPPEIKDPVLLHHPTRHSVGYFGAVRLRDGRFLFSRETGRFNALTFLPFCESFAEPAFEVAGASSSSSPTMPNTITPSFTRTGARSTSQTSSWTTCHL